MYVSLMSNPCKWTPKCFNCKPVNIYAFLYQYEKYVSVINTEFAISIMSTPTKFFPFSVRNYFYQWRTHNLEGALIYFCIIWYIWKVCKLNHECKILNHQFPCSSSPYGQSWPSRVCEFCRVTYSPFKNDVSLIFY